MKKAKKVLSAVLGLGLAVLAAGKALPALAETTAAETVYMFEDLIAQDKVKIQGRHTPGKATAYWSGNAVELNVELTGKKLEFCVRTTEEKVFFEAFIDGESIGRCLSPVSLGFSKLMFSGVTAGKHHVRVVRETGTDKSGKADTWFESVTMEGAVLERPKDSDLYIEFIGDSITCGLGSLGTYTAGQAWEVRDHSATHGFAYYLADALGADYSLVASGGLGLFEKSFGKQENNTGVTTTVQEIYEYTNGVSDYGHEDRKYDFARVPDLVVIRIGANDDKEHEENWRALFVELVNTVAKHYGKNIPVLFSGDAGRDHYVTVKAAKDKELKDYPLYLKSFTIGRSGSAALTTQTSGHPNASEQKDLAYALLDKIKDSNLDKPASAAEDTAKEKEKTENKSAVNKGVLAVWGAAAIAVAAAITAAVAKKRKSGKKEETEEKSESDNQ